MFGTVGATVVDGTVTDGVVSESREVNGVRTPEAGRLTGAQLTALADVEHTAASRARRLPGRPRGGTQRRVARRPPHVGRRGGRRAERRELPARHRRTGHGDRRLQRHRPSPTLAQFQQYVKDGRLHYFVSGGGGMGGGPADEGGAGRSGGNGTSAQITSWVQADFAQVTAGSATFYDLTRPTSES